MKKMGRPKGDNNMVKSYTIRMDDATLARLEAYCSYMNIPKSDAIRTAINNLTVNKNDLIKGEECSNERLE